MSQLFSREPIPVTYAEPASMTERPSSGFLHAERLRPHRPNGWAAVVMHPTGLLHRVPLTIALADAGFDVLSCATRYVKNGATLLMEHVAFDVGMAVRHVREHFGADKVALVGWSGGASIAALAQAEATSPSITRLPDGTEYLLAEAGLAPADALVHVAGHRGRAHVMRAWLDPSVLDENDPGLRDASLSLYGPSAPSAPYDGGFLQTYRRAQRERHERIARYARQTLSAYGDRSFVVHGTTADPRFLDLKVDANDRKVGYGFGDPAATNDAPSGLGRYTSCMSFLSQWSVEDSLADALPALRRIDVPYLMVENEADDVSPRSHVLDLVGAGDGEHMIIEEANHFYTGQPEKAAEAAEVIRDFLFREV
ncbi:MAG: alpha/beta hydrolase [Myxococcota bacterium]